MYTIKLLFVDFQGGHLGFKGGKSPPAPLNAALFTFLVRTRSMRIECAFIAHSVPSADAT